VASRALHGERPESKMADTTVGIPSPLALSTSPATSWVEPKMCKRSKSRERSQWLKSMTRIPSRSRASLERSSRPVTPPGAQMGGGKKRKKATFTRDLRPLLQELTCDQPNRPPRAHNLRVGDTPVHLALPSDRPSDRFQAELSHPRPSLQR